MYDFIFVNRHHSTKLLSFRENRLFAFWRQDPRWRRSDTLVISISRVTLTRDKTDLIFVDAKINGASYETKVHDVDKQEPNVRNILRISYKLCRLTKLETKLRKT